MSAIVAPTQPREVTTEWLDAAISSKYPDVRVISSHVDEFIVGNSGKVRVTLSYNDAGNALELPSRVIVKGGFQLHGPEMEYIYLNEIRFYRDILPSMARIAPLCLYAERDEQNQQSLVILEDLSLRKVHWCHATRPMAYQDAANFLKAIATYNARWWQSAELLPGGRFGWMEETLDGWVGRYLEEYLEAPIWNKYMALERGAAIPRVLHDRERLGKALRELKKLHKGGSFCLTHGDEHQGNLYIEPDGRPGFLDWQVKRAPWSQGVSYFVIAGLDIVDRRNWERGLLAHYLDCLEANGVRPPSFETAWLAYRRDVLYGFLVWVVNDVKYQPETVNVACTTRFAAAMLDHDTFALLN